MARSPFRFHGRAQCPTCTSGTRLPSGSGWLHFQQYPADRLSTASLKKRFHVRGRVGDADVEVLNLFQ